MEKEKNQGKPGGHGDDVEVPQVDEKHAGEHVGDSSGQSCTYAQRLLPVQMPKAKVHADTGQENMKESHVLYQPIGDFSTQQQENPIDRVKQHGLDV